MDCHNISMHKNSRSGFTLIELSVVLLVMSIMLGGILTIVTQTARIEKRNQLNAKLERIRTAMMDFRLANNQLPCPGDITLITSSSNFGRKASVEGDCYSGAILSTYTVGAGATAVVGGSVPVRSLGLKDEDAYDPWGNLFLYVVDKRITAASAFNEYPPTSTSIGNITALDLEGNTISSRVLYLVLSHGQNGHGGYMRSGLRKSVGSTNTREQLNCHCNASATATAFSASFYKTLETTTSASALDAFDDIVMLIFRNDMLSTAESVSETLK